MPDVRSPSEASCLPNVSCLTGTVRLPRALRPEPPGSALARAGASPILHIPLVSSSNVAFLAEWHRRSSAVPRRIPSLRAAHPSPRVTPPSNRLLGVLGSPAEPISAAQSDLRSHKPSRPASPRLSRSRSTCNPGVSKLLGIRCSARFRQQLPFTKASLPGAFGAIEPPGAGTLPSSVHTRSGGLTSGSSGLAALAAEPRR